MTHQLPPSLHASPRSPTQRSPSSVHRRTFSGASGGSGAAAAAAFDAYADLGSIPSTPSRVEGPERSIVAGGRCGAGWGGGGDRTVWVGMGAPA